MSAPKISISCALLNSKLTEGWYKTKENNNFIRVLSSVGERIHLDYESKNLRSHKITRSA